MAADTWTRDYWGNCQEFEKLARSLSGAVPRSEVFSPTFDLDEHVATAGSFPMLLSMVGRGPSLTLTGRDFDALALSLIDRGIQDERSDVYDLVAFDGFVEPIASFLARGFAASLRRFLESGLDPSLPMGTRSVSTVEMAQEIGTPEMVNMLRSFDARQLISATLDASTQCATPPGP